MKKTCISLFRINLFKINARDRNRQGPNKQPDTSLAEREGFEPPVPVKARTLSRRLVSTTHPSLRVVDALTS